MKYAAESHQPRGPGAGVPSGEATLAPGLGDAADGPAFRQPPPALDHLRALRCLAAVAGHGSAIRAAAVIHLSQPAITRSILELEAAWQLPLFERASRGMVPTLAGARAAGRVEVLLQQLELGATEAMAQATSQSRWAVPHRFAHAVTAAGLKAFAAVATTTSEARAAQLLGLSQPSVHRAIRAFEQLAGTPLLQKSSRGTWLTASGAAMLRRVKLAIAQARALEAELCAWRGQIRGRVALGVLPLSVSAFVPQAIDAVALKYPDLELVMVDGTYESLVRQLLAAEIDVIIGALRPDEPLTEVCQEALFDDDLVVMARSDHPCLASSTLNLKSLLQWPWVSPLQGTPASAALLRVFAAAGLSLPSATLQANSPSMTRAMVLQTNRLALTSRCQAMAEERGGQLRMVPVDLPATTRHIGMAIRSIGEPSPDLQVLQDALREAARALVRSDTES
jgi:LysR family transcriptional regulator, regulator for genes of the gallate degradation pathway